MSSDNNDETAEDAYDNDFQEADDEEEAEISAESEADGKFDQLFNYHLLAENLNKILPLKYDYRLHSSHRFLPGHCDSVSDGSPVPDES